MNSSFDNDILINNLDNTITYMFKYVITVIYILGNIGNLLSFLIFMKKSWTKNVCVFYFKVFLLCDSYYMNSTVLANIFMISFQINLQNSSVILCKLYLYTSFLFIVLSPSILTLASIDRLLISSQNVDTRLYSSKRLAYFSISINTIVWIVINLHLLVEGNLQQVDSSNFICSFNISKFYFNFVVLFFGTTNVIYCLLMIILCIFAFKNVRRIQAIPREKRTNQIRTMTKKDFQLLRCLFVQDLIYIFFSMLYIIFYIYQAMTSNKIQTIWEQAILNFVNKFIYVVYDIYFSSNFLVFIILSKAFRHEFKRIIYKIIGKGLHPIREEENRQDNIELNIPVGIVSSIELVH